MTTPEALDRRAAVLDAAQRTGEPVGQQASDERWDLDSAYEVQRRVVDLRADRGERCVGVKLGFTSRAKMRQMGVDTVIAGRLTDAMEVADGGEVDLGTLIHPRVEPEVAFRLGRDVEPGASGRSLLENVDAVAPALEVIDSRYRDFRFSLEDVVADNTSAAAFVVGSWTSLRSVRNRAVSMRLAGSLVSAGSTAAILGDPVRSLHHLAALAARHRLTMRAGDVVLAGAATAAVPLPPGGTVSASVAGLGQVGFRVVDAQREKEST